MESELVELLDPVEMQWYPQDHGCLERNYHLKNGDIYRLHHESKHKCLLINMIFCNCRLVKGKACHKIGQQKQPSSVVHNQGYAFWTLVQGIPTRFSCTLPAPHVSLSEVKVFIRKMLIKKQQFVIHTLIPLIFSQIDGHWVPHSDFDVLTMVAFPFKP